MTPPKNAPDRVGPLQIAGLIALTALHLAVCFDVLRRKSPTVDEVAHLPAGLSYLDQRTFKMYRLSPPLGRLIPALAARSIAPPRYYGKQWELDPPNHWQFAFLWLLTCTDDSAHRAAWLDSFTPARIATACWSALTIPMLFAWTRMLFGVGGGWIAATLWCLSPNVVAHASLATTDIAAASSTFAACFAFWLWLERPGSLRCMGAGAALAITQLVKFSALWLYLFFPLWWLFNRFALSRSGASLGSPAASGPASFRGLAALLAVSILGINLGYLFEGTGTPIGEFNFVCDALTRPRTALDGPPDEGANRTFNEVHLRRVNRFRGSLLGWFPCPLPHHYVAGFDEQKFEADGKYQMYLNGELRHGGEPGKRVGWWYFYLAALAVKEPPGTWLLVVAGALTAWSCVRSDRRTLVPLLLLAIGPLATISLLTDICIGVRYVLPIYPFAFVLAGGVASARKSWIRTALPAAALIFNAVELARIHPHELSYFNALAGGPAGGRFVLIDSNLDWGQDLRGLARWLDDNPDWKREVRIAYMGTAPPEFEGIADYRLAPRDPETIPEERRLPAEKADPAATMGPQPGKFAVSVNFERGMQFHQPVPIRMLPELVASQSRALLSGTQMLWNPHRAFAYFQRFTPRIEPRIGYSILLFDISVEEANAVRREMGLPPAKVER